MALPSIDDVVQELQKYGPHPRETAIATITMISALLQAAVQREAAATMAAASRETANTMAAASKVLGESMDRFTHASNRGTDELAKWTAAAATWTKRLTLATIALFVVAAVQVIVMWFGSR